MPQIEDCLKMDGCEQDLHAAIGGMTKGTGAERSRGGPWRCCSRGELTQKGTSSFLNLTQARPAPACRQLCLPACLLACQRGPDKATGDLAREASATPKVTPQPGVRPTMAEEQSHRERAEAMGQEQGCHPSLPPPGISLSSGQYLGCGHRHGSAAEAEQG